MISDASKMAMVTVACVLGILVGFKVSSSMESNPANANLLSDAAEQRLLLQEEASNQIASSSSAVTGPISAQPPKWQLVIEKVLNCRVITEQHVQLFHLADIGVCRLLQYTSFTSEMHFKIWAL